MKHPAYAISFDMDAAARRLAGAIQCATVSWDDPSRRDTAAFRALHDHLASAFPNVARTLTREIVCGDALLYTWRGRDPGRPPALFLGHLDVVPAQTPDGTADRSLWTHAPFAGDIADGCIWGRGALDDKGAVAGVLEAADALIASGFQPTRTIYFAFGHNEEVDEQPSGAAEIAKVLEARGVRGACLIDEGGFIVDHVPGLDRPVAVVGVTEKRVAALELRAHVSGGHASMPPRDTAVGVLAEAIVRLAHHPVPARFEGPARDFFAALATHASWPTRFAFHLLPITRPLVLRRIAARPDTNALIRSTMAVTMIEASARINVLSPVARAVVNVRLAPGDTASDIAAHATRAIADDRVAVTIAREPDAAEPTPASTSCPDFEALSRAIRAIYPDAVVAPYVTVGATDARRYAVIAPNAYRILPVRQRGAADLLHGVDERITVEAYAGQIRTYAALMVEWGSGA